ncbi:MAG: carbohydrate esterase [Bacteroidales bacterium]|jgi:hypothetical protein|nr:carbohydrate esterase [Bacteroidales bacterium]
MKRLVIILLQCLLFFPAINAGVTLFPANGAKNVNPDTHLLITFPEKPSIGAGGFVRIFDVQTGKAVDSLDLSIPAGPIATDQARRQNAVYTPVPYPYETTSFTNANTRPGTPSGKAERDTSRYQLTIIGRFTDGFHFYPIIVQENTAVIYLHHNLLEYGKTYAVAIDEGVLTTESGSFSGLRRQEWTFSTKAKTVAGNVRKLVVSNDGTGDFNTVQGAMDFIPDFSAEKWEVFIKNGDYEELVYFRNKRNVSIVGESRDGVVVHYANCEVFNPHPVNLKTNEMPGTFPSRRAAFAADNCTDLRFENLTIMTTMFGQAEGLLITGERNYLKNVKIVGSGDALQVNGSAYFDECVIDGAGDTVLGRGPSFFNNCTLSSGGPFMWIRNTDANHGNVFVNCVFLGKRAGGIFARSPLNGGKSYSYAEAVLINCRLSNIAPEGWGEIYGDGLNNRFWEYNSRTLFGDPVDVSQRNLKSRQLDRDKDTKIIEDYSNPEFVLGWDPFGKTSGKK